MEYYFIYYRTHEEGNKIGRTLNHYDVDWYWSNDIHGTPVIEASETDAKMARGVFGVEIKPVREAMEL